MYLIYFSHAGGQIFSENCDQNIKYYITRQPVSHFLQISLCVKSDQSNRQVLLNICWRSKSTNCGQIFVDNCNQKALQAHKYLKKSSIQKFSKIRTSRQIFANHGNQSMCRVVNVRSFHLKSHIVQIVNCKVQIVQIVHGTNLSHIVKVTFLLARKPAMPKCGEWGHFTKSSFRNK